MCFGGCGGRCCLYIGSHSVTQDGFQLTAQPRLTSSLHTVFLCYPPMCWTDRHALPALVRRVLTPTIPPSSGIQCRPLWTGSGDGGGHSLPCHSNQAHTESQTTGFDTEPQVTASPEDAVQREERLNSSALPIGDFFCRSWFSLMCNS